jgi:hypothetical protein
MTNRLMLFFGKTFRALGAFVACANPKGSFGKASLWEWQFVSRFAKRRSLNQ